MFKTIWIQARFIGEREGFVDGEKLSQDIELSLHKLQTEGYRPQAITPVTSGTFSYKAEPLLNQDQVSGLETVGGGYGYGYGFSFLSGVVITAVRKREITPSKEKG
jgi:hypothetical protein